MEQNILAIYGAAFLLLIGIIGYMLDQRNKKVDESLKELHSGQISLKSDMQSTVQLNQFLNERLKAVEAENHTFRNSFHSMDLWLAQLGKARPAHRFTPSEDERINSD